MRYNRFLPTLDMCILGVIAGGSLLWSAWIGIPLSFLQLPTHAPSNLPGKTLYDLTLGMIIPLVNLGWITIGMWRMKSSNHTLAVRLCVIGFFTFTGFYSFVAIAVYFAAKFSWI